MFRQTVLLRTRQVCQELAAPHSTKLPSAEFAEFSHQFQGKSVNTARFRLKLRGIPSKNEFGDSRPSMWKLRNGASGDGFVQLMFELMHAFSFRLIGDFSLEIPLASITTRATLGWYAQQNNFNTFLSPSILSFPSIYLLTATKLLG